MNERTIAKALESTDGDNVTVATKGGLVRPQGRWERRGSPQHLCGACEKSLQDLNVEVITLYQLHAPDPLVPFADSVGELARLQSEGQILNAGLSNVEQDFLDEAMDITLLHPFRIDAMSTIPGTLTVDLSNTAERNRLPILPTARSKDVAATLH